VQTLNTKLINWRSSSCAYCEKQLETLSSRRGEGGSPAQLESSHGSVCLQGGVSLREAYCPFSSPQIRLCVPVLLLSHQLCGFEQNNIHFTELSKDYRKCYFLSIQGRRKPRDVLISLKMGIRIH
jgi:hypothetical protein